MNQKWVASYLDGQKPTSQLVSIWLSNTGIEIIPEKGERLFWPYEEISLNQTTPSKDPISLERKTSFESIVVSDSKFSKALCHFAPQLFKNRLFRSKILIPTLIFLTGLTVCLYMWSIPYIASQIAVHIPFSWEEHLGQDLVKELAPKNKQCSNQTLTTSLDNIFSNMGIDLNKNVFHFRPIVIDEPLNNAFALPGGYIIIGKKLLSETKSAEELAWVLAHETQHVLKRHIMRGLLESTSLQFIFALLNQSGGNLNMVKFLGKMKYSRLLEEEADREGVKMLYSAGIDPSGFISFFKKEQKEEKHDFRFLEYLSTHPMHQQRINELNNIMSQLPAITYKKLIADSEWDRIKKLCH